MKRSTKRLVAFGSIALVVAFMAIAGVAAADTYTTGLESPIATGSVDGQEGWHSKPVPPHLPNGYDQEVVDNDTYGGRDPGSAFGEQSLRLSNALAETTGEFENQTYSPSTTDPAGETTGNAVFDGTFEFTSSSLAEQPGLSIRVSPDDGHGGRMSYIRLNDTPAGIQATFFDAAADGSFQPHEVGTYSRDEVHTVRFLIEFVPGEANDILRLFVDGVDIGKRDGLCFTTWESYYRVNEDREPPVTNSFEFRSEGSGCPTVGPGSNMCADRDHLLGHGYLFDNVTTITRNTDGPAPCGGLVPVGVIAPTATTCQQYRDNETTPMPVLEQLLYGAKAGKINAVSPGVFFYYTKVSGDAGNKVDITEANDATSAPDIPINQGQVVLYDASTCKVVKQWKPIVSSDGTATGTLPQAGDFIIGVKYNPSALKGANVPNPTTVTYTFGMELNDAVMDEASIDLVPKP